MDFNKAHLDTVGHGVYTVMSPTLLPPLYLAYNTNAAGDSGKVKFSVRFGVSGLWRRPDQSGSGILAR